MRWGEPRFEKHLYDQWELDGIILFMPRVIKKQDQLSIALNRFLGFRYLVVLGWRMA